MDHEVVLFFVKIHHNGIGWNGCKQGKEGALGDGPRSVSGGFEGDKLKQRLAPLARQLARKCPDQHPKVVSDAFRQLACLHQPVPARLKAKRLIFAGLFERKESQPGGSGASEGFPQTELKDEEEPDADKEQPSSQIT